MKYWLFKTEESAYSIDDLKRDKKTLWTGIRNYQVRNMLRDDISMNDKVLIYHSSSAEIGVVGTAEVIRASLPDVSALDKKDVHYDAKSTKSNPVWYACEIKFVEKFKKTITLSALKQNKKLQTMKLLQKGNRLSITPVSKFEFEFILGLSKELL